MADWEIIAEGGAKSQVDADATTFENGYVILKSGGETVFIGKVLACTRVDRKKPDPPEPPPQGASA